MYTIFYKADRAALIDNALGNADDIAVIDAHYDDYIAALIAEHGSAIEIDYDSDQTTCCNSGEEPAWFVDFWSWYN